MNMIGVDEQGVQKVKKILFLKLIFHIISHRPIFLFLRIIVVLEM